MLYYPFMDWVNKTMDKLIGIVSDNDQTVPFVDRRSRRLARCEVAWNKLGDALCGDAARFSGRSPQGIWSSISSGQIHLYSERDQGTLLLVTRNPDDPVFTYPSLQQKPNNWVQHGGTITPRRGAYMVRDSANLTRTMALSELSEFLLRRPLFGDLKVFRP